MKKRLILMMMTLLLSVSSFAQFEKGKTYFSTGFSSASLTYTGSERWKLDLGVKGGYMLEDCWMGLVQGEYSDHKYEPKALSLGVAVRYYLAENGIFLGAGVNYYHHSFEGESHSDMMPTVHVGYAHFLGKSVTVEPEVFYNQSLKNHGEYSKLGFRLNLGIYLDDLF
jgi:hypothetical protein